MIIWNYWFFVVVTTTNLVLYSIVAHLLLPLLSSEKTVSCRDFYAIKYRTRWMAYFWWLQKAAATVISYYIDPVVDFQNCWPSATLIFPISSLWVDHVFHFKLLLHGQSLISPLSSYLAREKPCPLCFFLVNFVNLLLRVIAARWFPTSIFMSWFSASANWSCKCISTASTAWSVISDHIIW